jgi:hydrogen peroxide-dependent heme synthase
MDETLIAPLTLEGWYILHQFFRVALPADGDGMERAASDLQQTLATWENLGEEGWTGVYRIVGGGTDYLFVHFRPSLEALGTVERTLNRLAAAANLVPTGDYVSVVELGMYHLTANLAAQAKERGVEVGSEEWEVLVEESLSAEREKRYVNDRLHPTQPEEMPYVCFYPMDKRRNEGQNWYTLPLEERAAMMRAHGTTGRRFAGRISQVISGSVGLDDWEWAVTLFGRTPLDFKTLVTDMRYDRVSAVYAEFGSFWIGYRIPAGSVAEELTGR